MQRKIGQLFILLFISLFVFNTLNAQSVIRKQLLKADSVFFVQNWQETKTILDKVSKDTVLGALHWTRLGFSNYNLKKYDEALSEKHGRLQK
jgi:hypothetical protein